MCSAEKCFQVETGSYLWGIFSVIGSAIGLLVFFLVFEFRFVGAMLIGDEPEGFVWGVAYFIFDATLMAFVALTFVFSIFLILGVLTRTANSVRAYYIFGVAKIITLFTFFVIIVVVETCQGNFVLYLPQFGRTLASFGFFSLILHMVKLTYKKFRRESIEYTGKILT